MEPPNILKRLIKFGLLISNWRVGNVIIWCKTEQAHIAFKPSFGSPIHHVLTQHGSTSQIFLVSGASNGLERMSHISVAGRNFVAVMSWTSMLRVDWVLVPYLLLNVPVAIASKVYKSVFVEDLLLFDHVLKVSLFLLEEIALGTSRQRTDFLTGRFSTALKIFIRILVDLFDVTLAQHLPVILMKIASAVGRFTRSVGISSRRGTQRSSILIRADVWLIMKVPRKLSLLRKFWPFILVSFFLIGHLL